MTESARIARGKIQDIARASAKDFDAVVFPGGYGAVQNLCSFAKDGVACKVEPSVAKLLEEMHAAGKPIGLACDCAVIGACGVRPKGSPPEAHHRHRRGNGAEGPGHGAEHQQCSPTEICVDAKNKVVTTPCYMTASGPWEVFQGAERMVEEVLKMA